ncbi:hypothetical protein [Chitiniphilus eburneus]|uniref:hypothetical protein n=1 Tax=Chitiniphilus eburneus TaxID=2571148 RepID=UPI0035D08EE6
MPFKFQLGQSVCIKASNEIGEVIARSDFTASESQYLIRYVANDGRATENWWAESALD